MYGCSGLQSLAINRFSLKQKASPNPRTPAMTKAAKKGDGTI